ncbi:AzlD domain-containing protein [uncultured Acidaminococcus sp.]|jgi:branched-subunit amino acid transport protein|uniref:AzlD domain-containing protein n=1 Tax=uncultured Acidaminococcus sp. TaxID=352152 RepID=UPI0025DBE655|nr:AzlD domain-containing protein [uncultured Acidaminococcus sp.]
MNDFWESFRLANSYSNTYAMGAIFAMALATFLPRFFPMALLKNRTLPSWFTQWLHFVPPAIFGALVFPDLLLKGLITENWGIRNLRQNLKTEKRY